MELTIFTPAFNRMNTLDKLYDSLCAQTNKNFEWVIVDDGSVDDTKKIVSEWINTNHLFTIIYQYQKNMGKHVAINTGVQLASGKWFFIVDSDDYLTEDAIAQILYYCKSIDKDYTFAGVVGLRGDSNGGIWNQWYTKNQIEDTKAKKQERPYLDATSVEYRYKYKIQGDRAEVVRTEVMKKYPFPRFGQEKFLSESYLWLTLSNAGYKFRWFNNVIYITTYLEDGLTQNIDRYYRASPQGSMAVYNLKMYSHGMPILEKIKSAYNYCVYGKYAGKNIWELSSETQNIPLFLIGFLLSVIRKK